MRRNEDDNISKTVLNWRLMKKLPRVISRKRWLDIEEDLERLGVQEWMELVQDREKLMDIVMVAKTLREY